VTPGRNPAKLEEEEEEEGKGGGCLAGWLGCSRMSIYGDDSGGTMADGLNGGGVSAWESVHD